MLYLITSEKIKETAGAPECECDSGIKELRTVANLADLGSYPTKQADKEKHTIRRPNGYWKIIFYI